MISLMLAFLGIASSHVQVEASGTSLPSRLLHEAFAASSRVDTDFTSLACGRGTALSRRKGSVSRHEPLGVLALLLVQNLAPAFRICSSRIACTGRPWKHPGSAALVMNNARGPWDFGRFLKTAGFYDVFRPRVPLVSDAIVQFQKAIKGYQFKPGEVIWTPSGGGLREVSWGPLDDVVMGGASKSELEPGQQFSGTWRGLIITDGGGFAGIRTKAFDVPLDWSKCEGVKLKVRGDGQRYKFILRDDYDWNGVAFTYSFNTVNNDSIETIEIPFSSFIPIQLARSVPSRTLKTMSITALQFTLSKFEYDGMLNPAFKPGPFELTVDSIELY